METSLTQVFTRPLKGREFFEEVIRESIDLGRPDRMQLLFDRRITKATPGQFRTRVIQEGVQPSLHVEYEKSHIRGSCISRSEGAVRLDGASPPCPPLLRKRRSGEGGNGTEDGLFRGLTPPANCVALASRAGKQNGERPCSADLCN